MGFFDETYGNMPVFASVDADCPMLCSINVKTIAAVETEVDFTKSGTIKEALADFRDFSMDDGSEPPLEAEDGEHRIPFWACKGLQKVLEPHRRKTWVEVSFTRLEQTKGEKTINSAHWVVI